MDMSKYENKMFKNTREVELHGVKPGQEFSCKVDKEGTPLEKKYRRRLKDGDFVEITVKKGGKK